MRDVDRWPLPATIGCARCLSIATGPHNSLCEMSIDSHRWPHVRKVYRWSLPATIDCTSCPSIAISRYTRVNCVFWKLVQTYIVDGDGYCWTQSHTRFSYSIIVFPMTMRFLSFGTQQVTNYVSGISCYPGMYKFVVM